jgi:HEAT repeat protein
MPIERGDNLAMKGNCILGIAFVCLSLLVQSPSVGADPAQSQSSRDISALLASPGDVKGKLSVDLLAMLQDERPLYRIAAIEELSRRAELGLAPRLKDLLKDDASLVRIKAASALLDMGDVSVSPVLHELFAAGGTSAKMMVAEVLARHGDATGIDYMKAQLTDARPTQRMRAIRALAASPSDEAAYAVLEAGLKDSDDPVRRSVIYLLGQRSGKQSVKLLESVIYEPDRSIRWLSLAALAKNANREAIPLLIGSLTDQDPSVRSMAAFGLNHITGQDRLILAITPERATELQAEWRAWWEANKDKPLPGEKK